MKRQVDVLIIGGGPAGLASGMAFAAQGLTILVCEQRAFPVDKACGEGIMPTGRAHLQQLGVLGCLPPERSFAFRGVHYHTPGGKSLKADFAEGPGVAAPRRDLSAALLRRAQQFPNLEVRPGVQATPIAASAEGVHVEVAGDPVLARLLVGADGRNSGVRSWAGLNGPPSQILRWGARQHFCTPPWSEYVEVFWRRGLEAYVTPVSPGQVGVAFLWERDLFTPTSGGRGLIPGLLAEFPDLQARLGGAPVAGEARAVGPLQRQARGVVSAGTVLVGDAGGYLDALTGEGISLALAQALAAAETAGAWLRAAPGRSPGAAELRPYARAHRRITGPYLFFTRLALAFSRRPLLLDTIAGLAQKKPVVFSWLLSLNMGRLPARLSEPLGEKVISQF